MFKLWTPCAHNLSWHPIVTNCHGRETTLFIILVVLSRVKIQRSLLNPFAHAIVFVGFASQTEEPNVVMVDRTDAHSGMWVIHCGFCV